MTKCDHCGKEIVKEYSDTIGYETGGLKRVCDTVAPLPFTCRHCHGSFCGNCRLPESHNCPGFNDKMKKRRELKIEQELSLLTRQQHLRSVAENEKFERAKSWALEKELKAERKFAAETLAKEELVEVEKSAIPLYLVLTFVGFLLLYIYVLK